MRVISACGTGLLLLMTTGAIAGEGKKTPNEKPHASERQVTRGRYGHLLTR
jgi:hypothetical protein